MRGRRPSQWASGMATGEPIVIRGEWVFSALVSLPKERQAEIQVMALTMNQM